MKNRLLIALNFVVVVSVVQLSGSSSPVTVTGIDGLSSNLSANQQLSTPGKKPLVRRGVTKGPLISQNQINQSPKNSAGNASVFDAASGPKQIVASSNSNNFLLNHNPLRAQQNSTQVGDVSSNAQSAPESNVKNKAAMFGGFKRPEVAKSYQASNVPVDQGHVSNLRAKFQNNNASTVSNNNVSRRRSSVVVNKELQMNQAASAAEATPQTLESSDVAFDSVYNSQPMDSAIVSYDASPLNNDLSVENLYDASVVEARSNPLKEGSISYANAYPEENSLGSALRSSEVIDNRYNPSRRSSSTDLVVYDPTQKYQKSLEAPNYQLVQPSSSFAKATADKQTTNKQAAQKTFAGKGIALNNAFNLAQQNKVTSQVEEPLIVEQDDMPEWVKNVKLPDVSAKPTNSGSNVNQTESMLNSRATMLEGFQAQTAKQAQMKQFEATQRVLQAKKPAYKASIL